MLLWVGPSHPGSPTPRAPFHTPPPTHPQFHPTEKNTVLTVDDISRAHVWRGDTAEKLHSFRLVDPRHATVRASSVQWYGQYSVLVCHCLCRFTCYHRAVWAPGVVDRPARCLF